jgi:8-oxo-dGTP pyrophosphatase MutT (NUDIX family)
MKNPQLKHRIFHLISRVAFWTYRRFPVFGPLRGSVGVIRDGSRYLVIDRSDARGLSLAGGLAFPWESDETALKREVKEETGLRVIECKRRVRYFSSADVPCYVTAFDVRTEGQSRGSWEGDPVWVSLPELEKQIILSQRPLLEQLTLESNPQGR